MFQLAFRRFAAVAVLAAAIAPPVARGELSAPLMEALEALRFRPAALTPAQRALLFQNNDVINRAARNAWITDAHYQAAQADYAALNRGFAERAAKDAGAGFTVQKTKSQIFQAGTDSDYILTVKSNHPVEKIREIQGRYNSQVNAFLEKNLKSGGLTYTPREDWHNRLDVDFMADPKYVTQDQFEQIAKLNNGAYKRRLAAQYEALVRAAGNPNISPEQFRAYGEEMKEFIAKKQQALAPFRQNPALLKDPDAMAEMQQLMALEQKYIERIESAAAKLRQQEGLKGALPKGHDPVYEVTYDKDGNAVLRQRSDASIAARGAIRTPAQRLTTINASAVAQNSTERAVENLAEAVADAARKNPQKWASAADDIAALADKLPPSAKGRLIESIKAGRGAALAEQVAEAMRARAKANPAALSQLDDALRPALGAADDVVRRWSNLRRQFEAEGGKALGELDKLQKLGVAIELNSAAQEGGIWIASLRKAMDPNITDVEAEGFFRRAEEAAHRMAKAGGWAALYAASPQFAALHFKWMLINEGTRYILSNTETGQAIDRAVSDYYNRHRQAAERAKERLIILLGGTTARLAQEDEIRQIEADYWAALRKGRIRTKANVTTIAIAERIRARDWEGAEELIAYVTPDDPGPVLADLQKEAATVAAKAGNVRKLHAAALADAAAAEDGLTQLRAAVIELRSAVNQAKRGAEACKQVAALKENIQADAQGAVKAEATLRTTLDDIDERARPIKNEEDRARVLTAYDKARRFAGQISASARHAKELNDELKRLAEVIKTGYDAQDRWASWRNTISERFVATQRPAATAESLAQDTDSETEELLVRRDILRAKIARMRGLFPGATSFQQAAAALDERVLAETALPLESTDEIRQRSAAAAEAAVTEKEAANALIDELEKLSACLPPLGEDAKVVEAQSAADQAAKRLAESESLREAAEKWKPGVKLTGGGRPKFGEGFGPAPPERTTPGPGPKTTGQTRRPRFGEGFGPAPRGRDVVVDPPRETPTEPERRPVEPPPPRPEPVEEIPPFYVVYGVHAVAVDRLVPPEGVDAAAWLARLRPGDLPISAKPVGYIAFRVSGDVLEDFAAYRKAVDAGTVQGEYPLFAEGGRFHQMLTIHQGDKALTVLPVPLFMSFLRLEAERPTWVERTQFGVLGDKGVSGFVGELSDKGSLGGGWEFQQGQGGDKAVAGPLVIDGTGNWGDKPRGAAIKFINVVGNAAAEAVGEAFR